MHRRRRWGTYTPLAHSCAVVCRSSTGAQSPPVVTFVTARRAAAGFLFHASRHCLLPVLALVWFSAPCPVQPHLLQLRLLARSMRFSIASVSHTWPLLYPLVPLACSDDATGVVRSLPSPCHHPSWLCHVSRCYPLRMRGGSWRMRAAAAAAWRAAVVRATVALTLRATRSCDAHSQRPRLLDSVAVSVVCDTSSAQAADAAESRLRAPRRARSASIELGSEPCRPSFHSTPAVVHWVDDIIVTRRQRSHASRV